LRDPDLKQAMMSFLMQSVTQTGHEYREKIKNLLTA